MKLIYVAGPYRGQTKEHVALNVSAARHVGQICARLGWYPVIPHANTALFDFDFPALATDEFYLQGTLELLRRCDAVIMVAGHEFSTGAKAELLEAQALGLPVYMATMHLPDLTNKGANNGS